MTAGEGWLRLAQFAGIMLYVSVAGVMWGTWLALARTMTQYDATTFLADGQHMIANLAVPMAVLMIAALVVGALVTLWLFRIRSAGAARLSLAGWVLMLAVLIITLAVEVPIDNLIATWTVTSLPADWQQLRERWAFFHTVRTVVSLAAVAAAVAAALITRTRLVEPADDRRTNPVGAPRS
jgi:uncharacterized membrane protein